MSGIKIDPVKVEILNKEKVGSILEIAIDRAHGKPIGRGHTMQGILFKEGQQVMKLKWHWVGMEMVVEYNSLQYIVGVGNLTCKAIKVLDKIENK